MTAAVRSGGDVWVFAYGSLMWRPGFAYQEAVRARLHGWHRAYCVYSVHYRGTTERPGLVLGLARGGVCDGVAYRIGPEDAAGVHNYLRERELIYGVYREKRLAVALSDGSGLAVHALAYVADTTHVSFAGMLPLERAARIIRGARGLTGTNLDYLANTIVELQRLGIAENNLERLLHLAGGAALTQSDAPRPRAKSLCEAWARKSRPVRPVKRSSLKAYSFRARLKV
jgi:glutathione-specific gamma-glutamylcyclotransferase